MDDFDHDPMDDSPRYRRRNQLDDGNGSEVSPARYRELRTDVIGSFPPPRRRRRDPDPLDGEEEEEENPLPTRSSARTPRLDPSILDDPEQPSRSSSQPPPALHLPDPEEEQLRLALLASEEAAKHSPTAAPADDDDDELARVLRASQEEHEKQERQRRLRAAVESQTTAALQDALAESRRLSAAQAERERLASQVENDLARILRESAEEDARKKAADTAELERLHAIFGAGVEDRRAQTATVVPSNGRPRRERLPALAPIVINSRPNRAPTVSSPLARPSNLMSAECITSSPTVMDPPTSATATGPRRQVAELGRRATMNAASTRQPQETLVVRERDRVGGELSRSVSARPAERPRAGSSPLNPNNQEPSRSSTTPNQPPSSRNPAQPRPLRHLPPSNPRPRRLPSPILDPQISRALSDSQTAQRNRILQTADFSDPRYLAALASLDQVDGQAARGPDFEEGLDDDARPPSYNDVFGDLILDPSKFTTTSAGESLPGKRKRITPDILARMMSPKMIAEIRAKSLPPSKTPKLPPLPPAPTTETAADASLDISTSIQSTLARTLASTASTVRPAPAQIRPLLLRTAAANERRTQMTQLADRDRPVWNEAFSRIPNFQGRDPTRRVVPRRTGL